MARQGLLKFWKTKQKDFQRPITYHSKVSRTFFLGGRGWGKKQQHTFTGTNTTLGLINVLIRLGTARHFFFFYRQRQHEKVKKTSMLSSQTCVCKNKQTNKTTKNSRMGHWHRHFQDILIRVKTISVFKDLQVLFLNFTDFQWLSSSVPSCSVVVVVVLIFKVIQGLEKGLWRPSDFPAPPNNDQTLQGNTNNLHVAAHVSSIFLCVLIMPCST